MTAMKLGFILNGVGYGWGDWRHPAMPADASTSLAFNLGQALTAERGKFDYLFIADGVYADADSLPKVLSHLEPLALLSAIAGVTSHIGLVGTISTTYSAPYNTARQLASLDKVSRGRAGWNVVTTASPGAAQNYGREEHLAHADRYQLAEEFLEVARGLWDSYEDGAIVGDKERGLFLDKSKLHTLDHHGEFFQVRGPLNIDRTPQGHPVIFQAGTSDTGRDFAARHADAVFTMPKTIEEARDFTADLKARAAAYGRDPAKLLILPGVTAIVGKDDVEVRRLVEERAALTPIEGRIRVLSETFSGYDFAGLHAPDAPFPLDIADKWLNGYRGSALSILESARNEGWTIRQAALRLGNRSSDFSGAPQQVADALEEWIETKACDGFMLSESIPGQLARFVDEVVPILQRRDVFRKDYEGRTLRDHFGLSVPVNRYAAARAAKEAHKVSAPTASTTVGV